MKPQIKIHKARDYFPKGFAAKDKVIYKPYTFIKDNNTYIYGGSGGFGGWDDTSENTITIEYDYNSSGAKTYYKINDYTYGGAANPSYSWGSDSDTGVYSDMISSNSATLTTKMVASYYKELKEKMFGNISS